MSLLLKFLFVHDLGSECLLVIELFILFDAESHPVLEIGSFRYLLAFLNLATCSHHHTFRRIGIGELYDLRDVPLVQFQLVSSFCRNHTLIAIQNANCCL